MTTQKTPKTPAAQHSKIGFQPTPLDISFSAHSSILIIRPRERFPNAHARARPGVQSSSKIARQTNCEAGNDVGRHKVSARKPAPIHTNVAGSRQRMKNSSANFFFFCRGNDRQAIWPHSSSSMLFKAQPQPSRSRTSEGVLLTRPVCAYIYMDEVGGG